MGTRDERVRDLFFEAPDAPGDPTEEGQVRLNSAANDLVAYIDGSVKSLTTGSGLSPSTHEVLDQLVHLIAEDSYEEYTYSGNGVTDIVVWTDATKTTKIREENYTYTGNKINTIVTKQYDGSGTLVLTMTETYSYTGNKVDDITRTVV
jgi:hypothetical protein